MNRYIFGLILLFPLALNAQPPVNDKSDDLLKSGAWKATGKEGAVSAGGAGSVEAGLAILKSGGNASDAAAATILALTVTDARSVCFGGEVPIMVYDPKTQSIEVIAGQGVAPKLATRDYFVNRFGIPGTGPTPAAVPAVLDAVVMLLDRHGTKTFTEVVAPTLKLLGDRKQDWHADLLKTLTRLVEAEREAKGDRKRGLRLVADYFYRGPIAREIDQWSKDNGGLIRYTDLATHVTRVEEPVSANYRDHTVYKCGPWTQGPMLLQTLQLLEGFDLRSKGHNSPAALHLTAEAMKLAFADRDQWYADPLFVKVPLEELLSSEYVTMRRKLIDIDKASLEQIPGDPTKPAARLHKPTNLKGTGDSGRDTTTCVVADKFGGLVVATPSGWDGVVAGKTGIWLGTRLQSFNIEEGYPNCIEPGKRPRITLTPTIILKDKKPKLGVSVAGGDGQEQAALQVILNVLDFGLTADAAVESPRIQTNHFTGSFRQKPADLGSMIMDARLGKKPQDSLTKLGHKITMSAGAQSAPSLIVIGDGGFSAAGDPRAKRHAGAY